MIRIFESGRDEVMREYGGVVRIGGKERKGKGKEEKGA